MFPPPVNPCVTDGRCQRRPGREGPRWQRRSDPAAGPSRAGRASTSPWHLPWTSAPWPNLFSLAVPSAQEGWAVSQPLWIVPAAGAGLSSYTGASALGLPSAVKWEVPLSLSFCFYSLYSAVLWDLGSLHCSKGQGRSLASR